MARFNEFFVNSTKINLFCQPFSVVWTEYAIKQYKKRVAWSDQTACETFTRTMYNLQVLLKELSNEMSHLKENPICIWKKTGQMKSNCKSLNYKIHLYFNEAITLLKMYSNNIFFPTNQQQTITMLISQMDKMNVFL